MHHTAPTQVVGPECADPPNPRQQGKRTVVIVSHLGPNTQLILVLSLQAPTQKTEKVQPSHNALPVIIQSLQFCMASHLKCLFFFFIKKAALSIC